MARGTNSHSRSLAVWLVVSAAALVTWLTMADSAMALTAGATWTGNFEDLLVAVASAVLVLCAGWLWLITTATVVDLLRGASVASMPTGFTRRLVLTACGAAVVAGASVPALAAAGGEDHSLIGLPMPERAVASAQPHQPRQVGPLPDRAPAVARAMPAALDAEAPITVRAGDSLWSIASARLGPDAHVAEIDEAWRALYASNREAIGDDPDLIRPGLDLKPGSDRKAQP